MTLPELGYGTGMESSEYFVRIAALNSNEVSSKMVYICGKHDMGTNYEIY